MYSFYNQKSILKSILAHTCIHTKTGKKYKEFKKRKKNLSDTGVLAKLIDHMSLSQNKMVERSIMYLPTLCDDPKFAVSGNEVSDQMCFSVLLHWPYSK